MPDTPLSRRAVLLGAGGLLLSGCTRTLGVDGLVDGFTTAKGPVRPSLSVTEQTARSEVMYPSLTDGGYELPEITYGRFDPKYRRQLVIDPTGEPPGTIVVQLQERFLYFVMPGSQAIRYGVGVGEDGLSWSGRGRIQYKKAWPKWTPPPEMIERKPELAEFRGGMPGSLTNPLGARALYIYQGDQDTGYRVHGTPQWWTVGQALSSGCVRMINQDVIDLYDRVVEKTPIVII
ncbi:L,D-transpeptidase [Allomesorhizobium alhagi]|nr:L,D-transpeptidase [Mesorhizobium alhagi]